MKTIINFRAAVFALSVLVCLERPGFAQPISVQIVPTNNQVMVAWPAGLGLVQPQKKTGPVSASWSDFGAPTNGTSLTESPGADEVYYRLRFLAPTITAPPAGQTNVAGSNLTFSVTATGTAPLSYQWRKNSTNVPGQTATTLGLNSASTNDSGSFTVLISNRVGSVTSSVALLLVTNPIVRPAGIYMGKFNGQVDAGGFGVLLRSNGLAYIVGYNTAQDDGISKEGVPVAADGTFSATTDQLDLIGGTFTTSAVSGTFTNSTGSPGNYTGTRKADTGTHTADAGYYVGTFTNLVDHFAGTTKAVLAADGTIFFYSKDPTGDGGGFGTITANTVSATTVPDGYTVDGTLNTTTKVISGNYKSGLITVGAYSITRTLTP